MTSPWPALNYDEWSETCDTLHAYTQILGKLAVALAPPEPELQHGALRLTARGWETAPLPAPNGSGSLVVALDLRSHEAVVEHSAAKRQPGIALVPDQAVADVTRRVLEAVRAVAGPVEINPTPQEVPWDIELDRDDQHTRYDRDRVATYFAVATEASLALSAFRAPFRGRSTPVNAWWGSFDLAVNLFSGAPADPPATDFISRNAMDSQEVAMGWWPGNPSYSKAAFYAYTHPAPEDFGRASLSPPAARWEADLGEYVLDWDDVRASEDPQTEVLEFAGSAFRHACEVCEWDPDLLASTEGSPPPIR